MSTDWSNTVQKREKLNTHISTWIKMFAKLITGRVQVIRMERC